MNSQKTKISYLSKVKNGVTLGSNRGPQLFIIYIYDIIYNINDAYLAPYADNTSVVIRHTSMTGLRN